MFMVSILTRNDFNQIDVKIRWVLKYILWLPQQNRALNEYRQTALPTWSRFFLKSDGNAKRDPKCAEILLKFTQTKPVRCYMNAWIDLSIHSVCKSDEIDSMFALTCMRSSRDCSFYEWSDTMCDEVLMFQPSSGDQTRRSWVQFPPRSEFSSVLVWAHFHL